MGSRRDTSQAPCCRCWFTVSFFVVVRSLNKGLAELKKIEKEKRKKKTYLALETRRDDAPRVPAAAAGLPLHKVVVFFIVCFVLVLVVVHWCLVVELVMMWRDERWRALSVTQCDMMKVNKKKK
jgi:hypothetical protein